MENAQRILGGLWLDSVYILECSNLEINWRRATQEVGEKELFGNPSEKLEGLSCSNLMTRNNPEICEEHLLFPRKESLDETNIHRSSR